MDKTAGKVFLDANILLEAVMFRASKAKADRIIREYQGRSYISALTAHLVVHFGLKIVELGVLEEFLTDFQIIELSVSDYNWAFSNCRSDDFEDALQLSNAIKEGCGIFITFDQKLQKTYAHKMPIKVVLG